MFIDYLLLFISIFFVWRELFPKTDSFNPFLKRILYSGIAFLFLILSIVNVYKTNKENLELINTAKSILGKTDTINQGLLENLNTLSKTRDNIVEIDSVLDTVKISMKSQDSILSVVVGKSMELVELESKTFSSKRPFIKANTNDIKITFDSINQTYDLEYTIENSGFRTASRILIFDALFALNNDDSIKPLSTSTTQQIDALYPENDSKTWAHAMNISVDNLINSNQILLLAIKVIYFDDISESGHSELLLFRSKSTSLFDLGLGRFRDRVLLNKYFLSNKRLYSGFLIDNVEYQPYYPVKE